MAGITSIGTYIPKYRLNIEEVAKFWGIRGGRGEKAVAGFDEDSLTMAVAAAQEAGLDVEGPLPPDTAFLPNRRGTTDCFVCMYHDQGHIPLKALAFDTAVNITLGLPIIRTSVDHGTALDIAWAGKADGTSLREAVSLAVRLAVRRTDAAAESP